MRGMCLSTKGTALRSGRASTHLHQVHIGSVTHSSTSVAIKRTTVDLNRSTFLLSLTFQLLSNLASIMHC